MEPKTFRILSLDGGGIMGAFSAAVLAEFEEVTGRRIVEHFDLITGTSTGGIIAAGLAMDGTLGPPIISSGYWTDESALGTFDHHEAGRVDVRPGQGIASRCGASEHGTAESRGGRGRG